VLDIGAKVKKLMSKQILYSDEPIGEIKLITDFLPSPSELAVMRSWCDHGVSQLEITERK